MANILIFGGSRGLGAALSWGVPARGDAVWLVSRNRPDLDDRDGVSRIWIEADLSTRSAASLVAAAVGHTPLDVVIYNAGIWEHDAFRDSYDFMAVDDVETERIIAINLTSAITCIRALVPQLRKSAAAKLFFIGSTSGLDNSSGREVAYAASKFGLRGITHALRENLRNDGIAVTCLNPGNIGTITVKQGVVSSRPHEDRVMIPPQDLVALVKCVIGLSNASCVKEIDVMAMTDRV
jgi:NAD(P)-dependent dehydrogenase (short-subunit alcohol dehydrogenase family)